MQETTIDENGIYGVLYRPDQVKEQLPAIILLSGSDGGIPGANAIPKTYVEELIKQGFIVLALAYFGVGKLPQALVNIDLEYFEQATHWLQSHPAVNKEAIAFIGQSRGGELALILGTLLSQIKVIVAYAPSNTVTGGFPFPNQSAWSYKKHALSPYLGALTSKDLQLTELEDLQQATRDKLIAFHANTEQDPFVIAELFAARNNDKNARLAEIPVEKITCPVLLFSGGQDAIWTSTYYCESLMQRLATLSTSRLAHKHINYADAGHGLIASYAGSIYHPVGKFWCKLGGSVAGNQIAQEDSLERTLEFFRTTFTP